MRPSRYLDPERLIGYARSRFALPDRPKPTEEPVEPQLRAERDLSVLTAQEIVNVVTETIARLEQQEQYPAHHADRTTQLFVHAVHAVVTRTTRKRAPRLGRSKIADGRRSLLARHLPARPRRRIDKEDAVDALQRLIDLHRTEPDGVEQGVRMYLETITRNQGSPIFRDRESAGVYCEFLRKLGYQPNQIAFLHYPPKARRKRPSAAPTASEHGTSGEYWLQKLPIQRLLHRHPISTPDNQGRLAIQISYDNYTPTTAPDRQHRAFGFRTGIFAFAVWRAALEVVAQGAEPVVGPLGKLAMP